MLGSTFWVGILGGHLLATALTITLFVYVGRTESSHLLGQAFTLMVGAFGVWTVGSLVRLFVVDPGTYVAVSVVKWVGVTTAPVWFLVFALLYAGHDEWVTRNPVVGLLIVPVVTLAVLATTGVHGLMYYGFAEMAVAGAPILHANEGPWFTLFVVYGWGVVAIGSGLLVRTALRRASHYFVQSTIVVSAIGTSWVATFLYVVYDWPHPAIDPTPLAFTVTSAALGVGIFTTALIRVVPTARVQVIEAIDNPVIVFDENEQPVYENEAARQLFGGHEQSYADLLDTSYESDGGEAALHTNDGRRVFQIRVSQVTDDLVQQTGRIVYFNDVTELREREQRIAVLNRILRHNIRNDLNVTIGRLDLLREQLHDDDRQEHADVAKRSAQRVIQFADRARGIERTLQKSGSTVVSLDRIAEEAVHESQEAHPDAAFSIEYATDTPTEARVASEELLRLAVFELLENAVVHNEGDPVVAVRLSSDDETARLTVADNGPGIPVDERRSLLEGTEDSLQHGSGLGLWLVKWTASLSSGRLSFSEAEGGGAAVTVSIPTDTTWE